MLAIEYCTKDWCLDLLLLYLLDFIIITITILIVFIDEVTLWIDFICLWFSSRNFSLKMWRFLFQTLNFVIDFSLVTVWLLTKFAQICVLLYFDLDCYSLKLNIRMAVGTEAKGGDEGVRRRGCSCTKSDFLPEESFQSMSNYLQALRETPMRFKDRLLSRSMDSTEINDIKGRSEHEMKKNLNWWDLIWFGIGAVIGSGIFVLTGLEAKEDAGPAVVLSYVVSGISAMLSVFCYTEFAVEIPVAGKSFLLFCLAV